MKPLPGIDPVLCGADTRVCSVETRLDAFRPGPSSSAKGRSDNHVTLPTDIHRRTFLGRGIAGLGLLGLNSLLDPRLFAADSSHGVVNPLHHPAKAKRIIFLYQAGGPSHLETFDFKPKLREMHGKTMPESDRKS